MSKILIDEKSLISKEIDAIGLSDLERARALAALAKADALVGAFFAVSELFHLRPRRVQARPSLKLQK